MNPVWKTFTFGQYLLTEDKLSCPLKIKQQKHWKHTHNCFCSEATAINCTIFEEEGMFIGNDEKP